MFFGGIGGILLKSVVCGCCSSSGAIGRRFLFCDGGSEDGDNASSKPLNSALA